jgi:flavin-dependent dehydrogenase
MPMKPLTIIGGGLAGLSLGIMLRRNNVPVALIEAGTYPRHRVCGEFISGRGRDILRELGLESKISKKIEASCSSFHLKGRRPVRLKLDSPALCVSRYQLDALLAEEFERIGGILKTGERAMVSDESEGVVRATGRRRSESGVGHLIGLKAHALDAELSSDLELNFGDREYVGICRVDENRANVCGLFYSRRPIRELHTDWKNILRSAVWSRALENVSWDEESFCSVAGLTLDRHAPESNFAVGDAAAMIPPLTGNGMSMAFESAEQALQYLVQYSAGRITWDECLRGHAAAWRKTFAARLRWAGFVQSLVFRPAGQHFLLACTRLFPSLPSLFFSRTR